MTDKIRLLRELQGNMSQVDFADMLGISQSYLSMIYAGQRGAGSMVAQGLVRSFPERRPEIVGVFFGITITEEA